MNNIEEVATRFGESGFVQSLSPPLQMAIFLGSLVLLPAALSCLTFRVSANREARRPATVARQDAG